MNSPEGESVSWETGYHAVSLETARKQSDSSPIKRLKRLVRPVLGPLRDQTRSFLAELEKGRLRSVALRQTPHPLSVHLLKTAFTRMIACWGPVGSIGGLYYQDRVIGGAMACTSSEAMLLYLLAKFSKANHVCEVGSYVGWSSAHMAFALKEAGLGGKITCIDAFGDCCEKVLPDFVHQTFLGHIRKSGVEAQTICVRGFSPEVLPSCAPAGGWDLVFIDGDHLNGQPLRDVKGMLPFIRPGGVLVVHDIWMPDVRDALVYLLAKGWEGILLPTVNFLTVLWPQGQRPAWASEFEGVARQHPFYEEKAAHMGWRYGLTRTSLEEAVSTLCGGARANITLLWKK